MTHVTKSPVKRKDVYGRLEIHSCQDRAKLLNAAAGCLGMWKHPLPTRESDKDTQGDGERRLPEPSFLRPTGRHGRDLLVYRGYFRSTGPWRFLVMKFRAAAWGRAGSARGTAIISASRVICPGRNVRNAPVELQEISSTRS